MFQSATLKLTAWYLAILMSISIIFSVAIYQVTFYEINLRLENLQRGLMQLNIGILNPTIISSDTYRNEEVESASEQMILSLLYVNLIILVSGGVGSFLLARRTLRPIERAHDAMSRFTSDASHELRTPLAAMKTELEVALRDENLSPVEMRELLESSLEEANKLIQLSEVFLKLARLDYDAVDFQAVDLVPVVESVVKKQRSKKDRFTVTTRKKAVVNGNEPALEELVTILVENAIKYSPAKSPISVRVYEKRMNVVIEVTNQGDVISPEHLERLFERFYRGDASRTASSDKGYGLGLAIAKRIVDVHHGDIKASSNEERTVFCVSLPNSRNLPAKIQNSSL